MGTQGKDVVILVGYLSKLLRVIPMVYPEAEILIIDDPEVIVLPLIGGPIEAAGATPVPWRYADPANAELFYRAHRDRNVLTVLPGVEYGAEFAARLAERYGLPGATFAAARTLRDKHALRVLTAAGGVRNPASREVSTLDEVREFVREHPGAIVIKPANRQAAVGTRIVPAGADLDAEWRAALDMEEAPYVPVRQLALRMLVEEYIQGSEYSVELLVQNGKSLFANVTAKLLHPGPCPVEYGHMVPADIPAELTEALVDATVEVVDVVGMHSGAVHCEWIVRDGEPYLVECAGRLPGDSIPEAIEHAWPVALMERYVRIMSGEPGESGPFHAERGAAILFPAVPEGTVTAVEGLAEARAVEGVFQAGVVAQVGGRVNALRSSWDRVVGAAAVGSTVEEALRIAEKALSLIKITVEPDPAD